MTLQEKIDALPEWPARDEYIAHHQRQGTELAEPGDYWSDRYEAALARLALVLELAKDGNPILVDHLDHCYTDQRSTDSACTCGRDALLKALETP